MIVRVRKQGGGNKTLSVTQSKERVKTILERGDVPEVNKCAKGKPGDHLLQN